MWRAGNGILKVIYSSRVVLKEKKYGGPYLLTGSSVQSTVPDADGSLVLGGASKQVIGYKTRDLKR